jgi:hypothetical protein
MRNSKTARRLLVLGVAALAGACGGSSGGEPARDSDAARAGASAAAGGNVLVTVYKSPTCGCCTKWVDHIREAGFKVEVRDTPDVQPVKTGHGLPGHLASCHTALVGGYVVEGHVPADVIRRLLRERPDVAGIGVPGMPMGSPGMEGSYKDPYQVVAFGNDCGTSVYESR